MLGSICEIFIWKQTLYSKLTRRLDELPKLYKTAFRTALKFGKKKMDEYWIKMVYDTPYYYASVVLHPALTWRGSIRIGKDMDRELSR